MGALCTWYTGSHGWRRDGTGEDHHSRFHASTLRLQRLGSSRMRLYQLAAIVYGLYSCRKCRAEKSCVVLSPEPEYMASFVNDQWEVLFVDAWFQCFTSLSAARDNENLDNPIT